MNEPEDVTPEEIAALFETLFWIVFWLAVVVYYLDPATLRHFAPLIAPVGGAS